MASRGRSNFTAKVSKYRRPNSFEGGEKDNENGGAIGGGGKLFSRSIIEEEEEEEQTTSKRFAEIAERNSRDDQFGFVHYASGPTKTGWILNMKSVPEKG